MGEQVSHTFDDKTKYTLFYILTILNFIVIPLKTFVVYNLYQEFISEVDYDDYLGHGPIIAVESEDIDCFSRSSCI